MYVLVAFKVNEEHSIYYKKCRDIKSLKQALEKSFTDKDADFISIRRVKHG